MQIQSPSHRQSQSQQSPGSIHNTASASSSTTKAKSYLVVRSTRQPTQLDGTHVLQLCGTAGSVLSEDGEGPRELREGDSVENDGVEQVRHPELPLPCARCSAGMSAGVAPIDHVAFPRTPQKRPRRRRQHASERLQAESKRYLCQKVRPRLSMPSIRRRMPSAFRYLIQGDAPPKPLQRYAVNRQSGLKVLLKFYPWPYTAFGHSIYMHQRTNDNRYVCKYSRISLFSRTHC